MTVAAKVLVQLERNVPCEAARRANEIAQYGLGGLGRIQGCESRKGVWISSPRSFADYPSLSAPPHRARATAASANITSPEFYSSRCQSRFNPLTFTQLSRLTSYLPTLLLHFRDGARIRAFRKCSPAKLSSAES